MNNIRIFELQNPWRQNRPFFDNINYIKRTIFSQIKKWMNSEDIIVLLGARQTGKSTLMFRTISELINQNINPQNIFYFNLDNILHLSFIKDITSLLDFLDEFGENEKKKYIFIDEVQRLENCGLFLKQLYDLRLPLKIIVSGSSTLEIRAKIKESLTGRKKVFEVLPLSLTEINNNENKIDINFDVFDLKKLSLKQRFYSTQLNSLCQQLLIYGGYPKIYLQDNNENKIFELQEIYSSYLQKDIINFLNIKYPDAFNKLILLLAHQIGNIVNVVELANSLQLNRKIVQEYLFIIVSTYIGQLLKPFYTNKRQEVIKANKIYYLDCGLRNFITDNFNELDSRSDKGALVENFVFQEMKKQIGFNTNIKFWRTQNGAEVDFILTKAEKIIPIEVKSGAINSPQTGKAFFNFIKKYQPQYGFILSENYIAKKKLHNCDVYFFPYSWFLLFFKDVLKLI